MRMKTKRGYDFFEVSSAMQKAVRRGDARLAGYWAIELFESGYAAYVWRRLLTISAEDCWGIITHEVESLYRSWQMIDQNKKGKGRIFVAKAVILLSMARKCRDADHLTNLVYDALNIADEQIEQDLAEAAADPPDIPAYAFDVHTQRGRSRGKTKKDFFRDEFEALQPRQPGLFDDLVE